jgi:hypothetical protein
VGLQLIECELFVAAAAPARLEFRVEYRMDTTLYPLLSARQPVSGDAIATKPGLC